MNDTFDPTAEARAFRRRLYLLAAVAMIGMAVLTARLVWLQAMQ